MSSNLIGQKIICIDDSYYTDSITTGNTYVILKESIDMFLICSNKHSKVYFRKNRFKLLPNKKLPRNYKREET